MAVVYNVTLKEARMNLVLAAVDAGATAGFLEIWDAGYTNLLVAIELLYPCGTVTGDTLTFDVTVPPSGTAVATGDAAEARITDDAGVIIVDGLSVGGNVQVSSTSITLGDTVTLITGRLVHG